MYTTSSPRRVGSLLYSCLYQVAAVGRLAAAVDSLAAAGRARTEAVALEEHDNDMHGALYKWACRSI